MTEHSNKELLLICLTYLDFLCIGGLAANEFRNYGVHLQDLQQLSMLPQRTKFSSLIIAHFP